MTMTAKMNGQPRKSLAQQLDRLDGILDGLANSLNDAVADAVRDAVGRAAGEAVQLALRELLAQPELLRHLLPAPAVVEPPPVAVPPTTPAGPSWLSRAWRTTVSAVGSVGNRVCNLVSQGVAAVRQRLTRVVQPARVAVQIATQNRRSVGIALGVGAAVGVTCFVIGPFAAALLSGLSTAALTAVARVLAPIAGLLSADDPVA